jgi:TonB-linked SusC/RagA family outer membrane protein
MKKITFLLLLLAITGWHAVYAQRTVTGTVTSSDDGATIPGVTVLVKNSNIGTATNIDGKYQINVPADGTTLVFSYVGMISKEVEIGNQSAIDVALDSDILDIEGVVVTALGIEREVKALGYAVENVDGEELKRSGEVNAIQALASKAAGVQVISSSGTPGAGSRVLIRGSSTFTGENEPLIVVDGVPIDNTTSNTVAKDYPYTATTTGVTNSNRALDLNPDDIESVTILKGPAAAALYGVRAGSGAIVYTTKRGNYGQDLKVTYSFNADISQVNRLPELNTTYSQGSGGGRDDGAGGLTTGDYTPGVTANSWGPKISTLEGVSSYDNLNEFFQNGTSFTHNLGISAGGAKSAFRLSFSRLDQEGVVPNTDFARTSLRFTGDVEANQYVKMGASANYIRSGGTKVQNGSNISGVMLGLTRTPASFDLLGGEGENGYTNADGTQYQYFPIYDNTYWTIYENPFDDQVNRLMGNVFLDVHPYSWIKLLYRIGVDYYDDQRTQIYAIGSWEPPEPIGEVWENIQRRYELYQDVLVTGDKEFGTNWRSTLTLGMNLNHREYQNQFSRGRGLSIPGFYNLSNASNLYTDEETEIIRTAALFFDLNLDWKHMVYLNVTGRNEWASTFGTEKNNFFYPSASLSWVFTELFESKWFNFGKVRLAYAMAGINPDTYTSRTYFISPFLSDGFTDGISFPYLGQAGFGWDGTLGNSALEPELVTGYELGMDLRVLDGRLNLDMTLYRENSSNILVYRPIAPATGFVQFVSNSGKMYNQGIELVLDGDAVEVKDFTWNLAINFTLNRNEVTELAEGVDEINIEPAFNSMGSYAIVGEPYGVLYGTQWKKTDDGQLIINPETGMPYVDDLNGNIGNPYPDWIAGLRNTFEWKGLSLTFLLERREGGDLWNGTWARLQRIGRSQESADARDNNMRYVIPGVFVDDNGNVTGENNIEVDPYTYFNSFKGDGTGSAVEEAIQEASWWRLRDVTLSYHIRLKDKLPVIDALEVYFTGRNLWLGTDYQGVDPETSLMGSGSNSGGFDYFNNPGTKSYIFGLRADF